MSPSTGPSCAGVSVVVPVRDGRAHLGEAVASAWAQVPRPAQIIVVDDGSVDGSGDVARALGATVLSQASSGPGSARNLGVRTASSELVAFLDADDRMVPGRLAAQVAAVAADPGLDGVLGQMHHLTADGRVHGPLVPCLLPSGLLVRRRSFLDSGGFDPSLVAGEFVDWMARCRRSGRRFVTLDRLVVERRVHDANLTRDSDRLRAGYVAVARAAIERHRRDGASGDGGAVG